MEPSESRIVSLPMYPASVYSQTLIYYLATNFGFYHFIYRRTANRTQFAAFMLLNIVTSWQLAEITNPKAMAHYAAYINNSVEHEHRRQMTEHFRKNLFTQTSRMPTRF